MTTNLGYQIRRPGNNVDVDIEPHLSNISVFTKTNSMILKAPVNPNLYIFTQAFYDIFLTNLTKVGYAGLNILFNNTLDDVSI